MNEQIKSLPFIYSIIQFGGESRIRTCEVITTTELQSVPFGRSGISPNANFNQLSLVRFIATCAPFVLRRCKIKRFFITVKYSFKNYSKILMLLNYSDCLYISIRRLSFSCALIFSNLSFTSGLSDITIRAWKAAIRT